MNEDCIFCKIVNGDIPAFRVYEDEHVLAFLDITQGTRGHTLLVPKKHVENAYGLSEEDAAMLFKRVPKIARAIKHAFDPIGLNIINNNDQPLQSVFHVHIHLIPRYASDGMVLSMKDRQDEYGKEDYEAVRKAIKESLGH